jgi:hypothetical protein
LNSIGWEHIHLHHWGFITHPKPSHHLSGPFCSILAACKSNDDRCSPASFSLPAGGSVVFPQKPELWVQQKHNVVSVAMEPKKYRLTPQQWRAADEIMQEEASKPSDSRPVVSAVVNRIREHSFVNAPK